MADVPFATVAKPFISGIDPAHRPKNAPNVKLGEDTPVDRARELTGVTPPIPPSLDFLNNQGNWYTPFSRPGATGPYDIRGWHDRVGGK